MPQPLTDLVAFLTAGTPEYLALGAARFVVVLVFYGLAIPSVILAAVNLKDERRQRSGRLLWLWLARVVLGCAWFRIMLDTLPLGPGNAFHGWLETAATRSAVPAVATAVSQALLPQFGLVDPLAFLVTFLAAASFMLGAFVRIVAFGALLLTVVAWLGLYGDPGIWFWGFPFLALLCGVLMAFSAGRALGVDAWLRRSVPAARERRGFGRLLRLLT